MATTGLLEMLLIIIFGSGGQAADLGSLLPPQDYFKVRGIEITMDKMVELAGKEPVDGATQIAQLLALRTLGEDDTFKKSANYQMQRKVLEAIAAGKKAQDKLGFAKEYAQRALALLDGAKPPAPAPLPARADGLAWFPSSASFAFGIEYRKSSFNGSTKQVVQETFGQLPPEFKKEIYKVVDSLGNVELTRWTMAYAAEKEQGKSRIFMRFTGRYNQDWASAVLKNLGNLEVTEKKVAGDTPIKLLCSPQQFGGPSMAMVGNRDFLIADIEALHLRKGPDTFDVVEEVLQIREKKTANAATGNLKATLDKIPAKAVAYLAGEIPEGMSQQFRREFGAFPKKVKGHAERLATGLDIILQGEMDNEDQAKTFVKMAGKLRQDGLDALQKAPQMPLPGINLDEVKNLLNSLQLEPTGTAVNVRLLLSDETMKIIPYFMMGRKMAAQAQQQAVPVPK